MKFISGSNIKEALLQVSPSRIAVAYVGSDWRDYVNPKMLRDIVLSPTLGTNPSAVMDIGLEIGWERVHFLDNLHAKIYLGAHSAAVGSFNLTANGLGAGAEGLQEAGRLVDDVRTLTELGALLDDYQEQADIAYPTVEAKYRQLAMLRACWDRAVTQRVVVPLGVQTPRLADYRPVSGDEIYVCWYDSTEDPEYTENVIAPGSIEQCCTFLESDEVQPDRWILYWGARASDGLPDKRRRPSWMHIDEVVSEGASEAPYTKLAIQRQGRSGLPRPFDETAEDVAPALWSVLESDKFPEFRRSEDWSIGPTLRRLPEFFGELIEAAAKQHS